MSNRLDKSFIVVTQAGTPGTPAVPSYTYTETTVVCALYPLSVPGFSESQMQQLINAIGNGTTGAASQVPQTTSWIYECRPITRTTVVPGKAAVPGTPQRTYYDQNIGWNAGARSIAMVRGDGRIQYRSSINNVGMLVGMSDVAQPPLQQRREAVMPGYTGPYHPAMITFGWYTRGTRLKPIVRGGEVGPTLSFTANSVLEIRRRAGTISFLVDGVEEHTEVDDMEPVFMMAAALYAAGDYAVDPVIDGVNEADMSLSPLTMFAAETNLASASMQLPALTLLASDERIGLGSVVLPAFVMSASDRPTGQAMLSLPALDLTAYQTTVLPSYGTGTVGLPALGMAAIGLTGTIGSTTPPLQLPVPVLLASDRPLGVASMRLPALSLAAHALEGNTSGVLLSRSEESTSMTLDRIVVAFVVSEVGVEPVLASSALLTADMFDSLLVDASLITGVEMSAVMMVSLFVNDEPAATDHSATWVMHDETSASVQYENFAFNSFAKYKGVLLGAKADGVYALDGDTDGGDRIDSVLHFGKHDFRTRARKRVDHCYAMVASDGQMRLRVTVEGRQFTYRMRSTSAELKQQRFDIGRGLEGTYFTFELMNEQGADFELTTMDFEVTETTRRL